MANILDFNDNGGAIIEIPQIDSDYSLVLNHWKRADIELQKIEQDILKSDSPQRTNFLKKCAEEIQQFIGFEDSNILFEEKEYDSEEERLFYEEEQNKNIEYTCGETLCIYNFELKHSLAWYLMNRVNSEIEKIEQEIEIQKTFVRLSKSIDEYIGIIRKAKSEYQSITELIKHFSLSKLQAKAVVDLPLREFAEISNQEYIESKIKFLEFLKSFLEKLKE